MAPCKMWTGLIGLSIALALGLFFCLQQAPQDAGSHRKRRTPDGSHLRPLGKGDRGHPFLQNYWYRYVYGTVKSQNKTDCYVCSYMPTHSLGPTVYATAMNKSQAKCAASFGGSGYQYYLLKIDDNYPYTTGLRNGTCDTMFWVDFHTLKQKTTVQFTVHLEKDPKVFNHTMCYEQNRGIILTSLGPGRCLAVWK
ncbi:hypothetical protein ATANTOWER_027091 [Ataeniobius toweri]|uniref:Uncharacterized protein n=1 Tax=Ataeniobius toweri TaxID=208326 RepID=A0ABU7BIU3_9TELE|nr:hypothetical protein [Ataeniobius toweri]